MPESDGNLITKSDKFFDRVIFDLEILIFVSPHKKDTIWCAIVVPSPVRQLKFLKVSEWEILTC